MLSYFQQKLLLEMKEKDNMRRREQKSYQSEKFYRAMVKLERIGMIRIKKDRKTNQNTYSLTLDGHIFAGWIRALNDL